MAVTADLAVVVQDLMTIDLNTNQFILVLKHKYSMDEKCKNTDAPTLHLARQQSEDFERIGSSSSSEKTKDISDALPIV